MSKEIGLKERVDSAKKYEVDFNYGLNEEQVKERIESKLVNKQKKTVTKSYFKIIVDNIFTVLNMILIAMAVVMFIFHAAPSNFFFLVVLGINIGISLFQDIKARVLISKLSLLSNPRAKVIRSGKEKNIFFNELVLSDIVIIKQGNTIPTDGVLVEGSIKVNESILTGEMIAVKKDPGDIVYGESVVLAGTGKYQVNKISNLNYASTIQEKAKTFSRPKSEILLSLTKLIRVISIIAIILGTAQLISLFVVHTFDDERAIKFASSIIAMIPNGMYLMTSIALTVGVIVLSHNKILVRELYSIEMLARVNVICVDKTGTVTDGDMIVEQFIPIGKTEEYVKKCISNLLYCTKDDNLTAQSLRKFIPLNEEFKGPFYASLPFESEKKYSAASYKGNTVVMGAAGFFKVTNMKFIEKQLHKLEEDGKRIMLVAESKIIIKDEHLPKDLKVIGMVVMAEHIKDDAKGNIEWFQSNGVKVKMISGDAPKSLISIAKQVGIDGEGKVISLDGMSDDQVREAASKYNVFGRVLPDQKRILVDELRKLGNTVAMVGDGVNDLLALKQADCSIAMASGSDAVKAASHLVSLDSNFSSLPKVVGEGRRVINNLQRVCSLFLVKTCFAIVLTIIFFIFGLIHKDVKYPFDAQNLVMWETLTIGLAPFILALEPNSNKIRKGFLKNIFLNVIPAAVTQLILVFSLLIPGHFMDGGANYESFRSMSIILITLMSLVTLYNICLPFNKYRARVAGGITIVMAICIIGDLLLYMNTKNYSFFGIDYFKINSTTLIIGFSVFVVLIPIYLFVSRLVRNKIKKSE